MSYLYVGLGGGLGAILRFALSSIEVRSSFPLMTFLINLTGAVLIGIIAGAASQAQLSGNLLLFLKTGLCGGYTTFSTFSLESLTLLEEGKYGVGGVYMLLSLALCLAGVFLGKRLPELCFDKKIEKNKG